MNELATMDWMLDEWDEVEDVEQEEQPTLRLCEYIIDPKPFDDSRFDEGGEGD